MARAPSASPFGRWLTDTFPLPSALHARLSRLLGPSPTALDSPAAFISAVWRWKMFAIYFWSYLLYVPFLLALHLLSLLGNRGADYLLLPYPFFFLAVPIHYYVKALGLFPRPDPVPPLHFCASEFLFLFFNLHIFCAPLPAALAALAALLCHLYRTDFTVRLLDAPYGGRSAGTRLAAFAACWRGRPSGRAALALFVAAPAASRLCPPLFLAPALALHLLFVLCVTRLCAVICGEKTSFALARDCARLAAGLTSGDALVRHWAFADLRDIATDARRPLRRRFLVRDAGVGLRAVVTAVRALFDSCGVALAKVGESEAALLPPAALNDPNRFRAVGRTFRRFNGAHHPRARTAAGWLWAVIGGAADRLRDARNARSRVVIGEEREAKALGQAVLAMWATEAVAAPLLATATQEAAEYDSFGATQAHAETFLSSLTYLRNDAQAAAHAGWITPPFRIPWIAVDCEELAGELLAVIDRAWADIIAHFGTVLDRGQWDDEVDRTVGEFRTEHQD
jgi:hypothetical protein